MDFVFNMLVVVVTLVTCYATVTNPTLSTLVEAGVHYLGVE